MKLPNDPMLLLSVVNTYLRDKYNSLEQMCEVLDVDCEEIINKLSSIGYEYDINDNKFK